jgi:nitrogen fixation protein NifZ
MTPESRQPRYQWGQRVRAATDLINDGSYPDMPEDSLLAATGDTGEIVKIGTHTEIDMPVYLVEFASLRVIGCFEDEIEPV